MENNNSFHAMEDAALLNSFFHGISDCNDRQLNRINWWIVSLSEQAHNEDLKKDLFIIAKKMSVLIDELGKINYKYTIEKLKK